MPGELLPSVNQDEFRPLTKKEWLAFQGARICFCLGNLGEGFYLYFTYETTKQGLDTIKVPAAAGIPLAAILSGADFIVNICLVRPTQEALDILNMRVNESGALEKRVALTSAQVLSAREKFKKFSLLTALGTLMLINFGVGVSADLVGVKDSIGASPGAIVLMSILGVSGLSYYAALSGADVINDAHEMLKEFSSTSIVKLYKQSKLIATHATLGVLEALLYRSTSFAFIAQDTAVDVFNLNKSSKSVLAISGTSFGATFFIALFTRVLPIFNRFSHVEEKIEENLEDIPEVELSWKQKALMMLQSCFYGSARATIACYFLSTVADYIPDGVFIPLMIAFATFFMSHATAAEYLHNKQSHRLLSFQSQQQGDPENAPVRLSSRARKIEWSLSTLNIISQLCRTIQGIPFFTETIADYIGGSTAALVLSIGLGFDVNMLIQRAYFQQKLTPNSKQLDDDIESLANWVKRALCCKSPTDEERTAIMSGDGIFYGSTSTSVNDDNSGLPLEYSL